MRPKLLFLLSLLAVVAALPATASAKSRYKVGIGDQSPFLFQDHNFRSLHIKKVRLIVPWDWKRKSSDPGSIEFYLDQARENHKQVMVAFSAHRGCYRHGHYSRRKVCRRPSFKRFKRSVRAFHKKYRHVKTFQPWNELNSKSQPTYKSPRSAVKYFVAMRQVCRKCTIVAADILDSSKAIRYVKRFRHVLHGYQRHHKRHARRYRARLWGLHNYSDVNRHRARMTRKFLRAVPGRVWLTETGGLVKFLPHFHYSKHRAKRRVGYLFHLANYYSRHRRHLHSKITRVYQYSFFGYVVPPGKKAREPRFDAGLMGPLRLTSSYGPQPGSAKPRPAFRTFKRQVRHKSK